MDIQKYKKVLAIGAHPDDIECGCGGFIAQCIENGSEVYLCVMSKCDNQFGEYEKDRLIKECANSANIIRVKTKIDIHNIPNMELPEHRKEIMKILEEKQKEIRPELVLIPFINDPHQDHETVAKASVRTFRSNETILQYEILRHGSHSFTPNLFVDITKHLDKKLDALDCYISQISKRAYFNRECFKGLARTRGAQSGYDYAEGFLIYKMFW